MIMAVADERALQLIKSIVPTFIRDADAGSLEIARIRPGLVPCRLPEALVCTFYLSQELIHNTQIEAGRK